MIDATRRRDPTALLSHGYSPPMSVKGDYLCCCTQYHGEEAIVLMEIVVGFIFFYSTYRCMKRSKKFFLSTICISSFLFLSQKLFAFKSMNSYMLIQIITQKLTTAVKSPNNTIQKMSKTNLCYIS